MLTIWLITHPLNTPAILLYLKNGFQITGWKDNYYGDSEPRIIFAHNQSCILNLNMNQSVYTANIQYHFTLR